MSPNIWDGALDQRAATETPTDAGGLLHSSSWLQHRHCNQDVRRGPPGHGPDARRENLERSKCFPGIYLFNKNGKSPVYIKASALILSYRGTPGDRNCAVDVLSCIIDSGARRLQSFTSANHAVAFFDGGTSAGFGMTRWDPFAGGEKK